MKILIAEESAICRKILGATLKLLGHDVVETENGQQAWRERGEPVVHKRLGFLSLRKNWLCF